MNYSAVCYVDYVLRGGNATLEKDPFDPNASLWLRLPAMAQAGQKRIILAPEPIPRTGIPNGESASVLTSPLKQWQLKGRKGKTHPWVDVKESIWQLRQQ